jgi:two-component system nitrogen regulation response regulator GlnG
MTADGSFREDLYYRLVEFQISLPPLRERANDVDLLVSHFVERFSRVLEHDVRGIAPEALDLMKQYSWPGNVRELQSAIKHALVRTDGPLVNPESLPESIREERSTPADRFSASEKTNSANFGDWDCFIADKLRSGTDDLYAESMSLIDRHLLKHVLRHTRGNQLQAARVLGISRGTLRTKIHVLNIKTETER